MRIGILGSGFMGTTHARAYAKIPGVEHRGGLVAHLDKAEKLAEGGRRARDHRRPLDHRGPLDRCDQQHAADAPPPRNDDRRAEGRQARPPRKAVRADRRRLRRHDCGGEGDRPRSLMVAHVLRFWGEYVSLVEFVHSGKLGKPISAVATPAVAASGLGRLVLDPGAGAAARSSIFASTISTRQLGARHAEDRSMRRGQRIAARTLERHPRVVDYGGANGFVEGSEFMPQGYPFTAALKVLCEGGVVEFLFRAGGVSVEMGGGASLMVHEAGKAYPLTAKPGDAYDNQAEILRRLRAQGHQANARHARAGAARGGDRQCGATVAGERRRDKAVIKRLHGLRLIRAISAFREIKSYGIAFTVPLPRL